MEPVIIPLLRKEIEETWKGNHFGTFIIVCSRTISERIYIDSLLPSFQIVTWLPREGEVTFGFENMGKSDTINFNFEGIGHVKVLVDKHMTGYKIYRNSKPMIIKILENGPAVISNPLHEVITLVEGEKETEFKGRTVAVCRCGKSSKQPYCDGSHNKKEPEPITANQGLTVTNPDVQLGGTLLQDTTIKGEVIDMSHPDPKKDLGKKILIDKRELDKLPKEEQDQILKLKGTSIPLGSIDLTRVGEANEPQWTDMQGKPLYVNQGDGVDCSHPGKEIANSLYFTPSIEDIRVGYELEWRMPRRDFVKYGDESVYDWQPHTITINDFSDHDLAEEFHNLAFGGCEFRVPYLTKEQIEKEGWVARTEVYKDRIGFEKGNYFMIWYEKRRFVDIILRDPSIEERVHNPERFRFFCDCKDINTFRYICKLLNI